MNRIFDITLSKPSEPEKGVFEKFFDCLADWDGHRYYATKETYIHEDESFHTFKYKYLVEVMESEYMQDAGMDVEDGKVTILLSLVVLPESLSEKHLASVASFCGIDTKDVTIIDIYEYGLSCPIEDDEFNESDYSVEDALDCAAEVIPSIDSLRGFYLDRPRNLIGTTGWDLLEDAIADENAYNRSLERARKRMEEMGL